MALSGADSQPDQAGCRAEIVRTLPFPSGARVDGVQVRCGPSRSVRTLAGTRMRAIQQFTPAVLAEVIRRQPPSEGRTMLAWQIAVGAAIARATTVQLADGVLTVTAKDPRWVADVEASRSIVLTRLKQLLGNDEVRSIRLADKSSGRRPR